MLWYPGGWGNRESYMMTGNRSRLNNDSATKATSAVNGYPIAAYAVKDAREIIIGPPLNIKVLKIPQSNADLILPSSLSLTSCNLFKYGSSHAYSFIALIPTTTMWFDHTVIVLIIIILSSSQCWVKSENLELAFAAHPDPLWKFFAV